MGDVTLINIKSTGDYDNQATQNKVATSLPECLSNFNVVPSLPIQLMFTYVVVYTDANVP